MPLPRRIDPPLACSSTPWRPRTNSKYEEYDFVQAGDLIVEAAGKPITDGDELVEALASAGDTFEVKVVRGTEERTVSVGGGEATGEA